MGRRPPADPHDDLGGQVAELHIAIVRCPVEYRERLVGVTARLGHDDADRVVNDGARLQGVFELCGQVAGLEVAAYQLEPAVGNLVISMIAKTFRSYKV